jgi:hypothetical protein
LSLSWSTRHRLLWTTTFHCRDHKTALLSPTLSQLNPVHTITPVSFTQNVIWSYVGQRRAYFSE